MRSPSTRRATNGRIQKTRLQSFVRGLQMFILLGTSVMCGVALALFVSLSHKLPNVNNIEPSEATIIYSSDEVILGRIYREDRTNVPLKDIPTSLRDATVAIEDHRFYEHTGVDLIGIGRAMWKNFRHQKLEEGGSTLTQQLAKNVYLTPERTIQRKMQEAVIAILMERKFTKDKILELYLNQVFYGSGAFGVQAASRVYFAKDVDKLDLAESALLAGLPKGPTSFSPHRNLEGAVDRRNDVLDAMAKYGFIRQDQCDKAKSEKPHIVPKVAGRHTYRAPHFVDYVTSQLRERYGEEVLYRGLRVYTTLNYEMQKAAEKALRQGVKKHEHASKVTEGCFVCIEPTNGYIRAMVGSVNPASEYNRCTQAHRQPGSSFKAFVYTAAMMSGMKPTTSVCNERISYPGGNGKAWVPRNYDGVYGGWVSIKTAVAKSMNLPAIWTANKVGIRNVIKYANEMGVGLEPGYALEPYLPTAIGGIKGIHPIEMASAYGTFANNGVYVEPCSIIRVLDNHNQPIEDYIPEGRTVIPEKINAEMDSLFRAVVTGGTGIKANVIKDARGKTGTTSNDVDAWFIGYVPQKLVAACWVGNDSYTPMRKAYGGSVCAPVWVDFMKAAIPVFDKTHKDDNNQVKPKIVKDRPRPKTSDTADNSEEQNTSDQPSDKPKDNGDMISVNICDQSGMRASPYCLSTHSERFLRGTEPKAVCSMHTGNNQPGTDKPANDVIMVTVTVCSESGMLAGPNCPRVKKRFPEGTEPQQQCTIHNNR